MTVSFKRDGIELSRHSARPIRGFSCLLQHRQLILQLVKRDILSRYRGSFGGVLWSFVHPLLMLAIYTVVMGYLIKARWEGTNNSLEYSVVLFSGLILFNFFSECIGRSPALIVSNPNYVRKIVFPLEVLPWVTVLTAMFHTLLSLAAWVVFALLVYHSLHWTLIFLPLLLLPLMLISVGLCWFISATAVFMRDLNHVVTLVVQALMFLSPLFYSVKSAPPVLRKMLMINPLSFAIEQARDIMVHGKMPDFGGLCIYWVVSLVIASLGFAWFQHARDGFADVL